MDFSISRIKKTYSLVPIIIALICSFFVCITIFADRSVPIIDINSFFYALNGNNILTLVFFIFGFLVFKSYFLLNIDNKNKLHFTIFMAILFAGCETIGYNIDKYTKLFYPYFNLYNFIFNLLIFFKYFIIFYFFIELLLEIGIKLKNKIDIYDKNFKYFSNNTESIFFVSGILILFWSVYYFIFFPAVVTWDSYYQIEQGLGFRNLTDENPFLHTLFQGLIINIASKILGSINLGISVFCLIQMIFISLIIAIALKVMAKYSVPILYRILSFLFYLLHPLIGIYSVTLWKDIWIATFLLAYCILLIDMLMDTSKFFGSKAKILYSILVVLFIMLSKGTGIIFIVLSLIPILFKFRKDYFFKLSIIYLVPFAIFFLIRLTIMPCFNIQKGHVREPMSVPLQQIARTVKENSNTISEREKIEINEILPYDKLSELYNPRLSDNVKSEFNEKVYLQNPIKYAKLWVRLGFKYPKSYVESFLSNSYGYWYPETKYYIVSDSSYIKMLNFYRENNWPIYDKNIENYPQENSEGKISLCKFINDYLRETPIASMLFSIAFYFWTELFLLILCLKNKKYYKLSPFFIIIATFIICIMSPVHAEMRYAYPAVIIFPVIFCFSIFKDKEDTIENTEPTISHLV